MTLAIAALILFVGYPLLGLWWDKVAQEAAAKHDADVVGDVAESQARYEVPPGSGKE